MTALFRELICLSVFSGILLQLCPEGGVKRVASVLSAAVLSLSVLSHIGGLSEHFALPESGAQAEAENRIEEDGAALGQALNRKILQEEYSEYISQQAAAAGITGLQVELELEQDMEGFFLPYAATLQGELEPWQKTLLGEVLRRDLGIPPERQVWNESGAEE